MNNLDKILLEVKLMRKSDDIEGLTYMAGCSLESLILMGCPIEKELRDLEIKVDAWANKQPKNH